MVGESGRVVRRQAPRKSVTFSKANSTYEIMEER